MSGRVLEHPFHVGQHGGGDTCRAVDGGGDRGREAVHEIGVAGCEFEGPLIGLARLRPVFQHGVGVGEALPSLEVVRLVLETTGKALDHADDHLLGVVDGLTCHLPGVRHVTAQFADPWRIHG